MTGLRLVVILGTRPDIIKLAPVIKEARCRRHEVGVVFTGQHRDLALPLLEFFRIRADIDLAVMGRNQTLTSLSARVLHGLDERRKEISAADYFVVQGDTTTAFVASYWAFCHGFRVAHVEAGLRTYNLRAPFPEEANRQLIARIADLHFAPTSNSARLLLSERVPSDRIYIVGNTAIDALHFAVERVREADVPAAEALRPEIAEFVADHPLILVTAHRREHFGEAFQRLCRGIRAVADALCDVRVVYPVHPNPNVREPVENLLGDHPRILLCDPLPYAGFVALMQRARVLLTDSGGIQEEGPTLRKPILVMRDSTERPEGVEAGFARLVGTDPQRILDETAAALNDGLRAQGENPYGDGRSSARIIAALEAGRRQAAPAQTSARWRIGADGDDRWPPRRRRRPVASQSKVRAGS